MKVLSLACSVFSYRPTVALVGGAAVLGGDGEVTTYYDSLILLTTVERGDSPSQIRRAADHVHRIAGDAGIKSVVIDAFSHLSQRLAPPEAVADRIAIFRDRLGPLDIHETPYGWNKELNIRTTAEPWSYKFIHT